MWVYKGVSTFEKQEADAQGIRSGMSMYIMPGGVHKPKIVVSPQIQMVFVSICAMHVASGCGLS
jgi:hypothetical protein